MAEEKREVRSLDELLARQRGEEEEEEENVELPPVEEKGERRRPGHCLPISVKTIHYISRWRSRRSNSVVCSAASRAPC
jgi:hypothetical protein